jgi:hypothetical protein
MSVRLLAATLSLVQMVCLDELVPDDDVLRRSHARDCLHEDEGFARAIEDFMLSEVVAALLVCGTSSTVGVADPQAVPQPK